MERPSQNNPQVVINLSSKQPYTSNRTYFEIHKTNFSCTYPSFMHVSYEKGPFDAQEFSIENTTVLKAYKTDLYYVTVYFDKDCKEVLLFETYSIPPTGKSVHRYFGRTKLSTDEIVWVEYMYKCNDTMSSDEICPVLDAAKSRGFLNKVKAGRDYLNIVRIYGAKKRVYVERAFNGEVMATPLCLPGLSQASTRPASPIGSEVNLMGGHTFQRKGEMGGHTMPLKGQTGDFLSGHTTNLSGQSGDRISGTTTWLKGSEGDLAEHMTGVGGEDTPTMTRHLSGSTKTLNGEIGGHGHHKPLPGKIGGLTPKMPGSFGGRTPELSDLSGMEGYHFSSPPDSINGSSGRFGGSEGGHLIPHPDLEKGYTINIDNAGEKDKKDEGFFSSKAGMATAITGGSLGGAALGGGIIYFASQFR